MKRPGRFYPLGYLLVLAPPMLLVVSLLAGIPYLLFAALFGVAPLARALLGNMPEEPGEWNESVTKLLDRLPTLAAVVHAAALAGVLVLLRQEPLEHWDAWLGFGLSLFASQLCGIPVAHELIHRRGIQRAVGRVLSGLTGYPVLEGEHIRHHSVSGIVEQPEWPRLEESVWGFVGRRLPYAFRSAWNYHKMLRHSPSGFRGLAMSCGAMVITGAMFGMAAGVAGVLLYLCIAVAVQFSVHAINYIQHWGLGSDSVPNADEARYGWECRCVLQGWVMLNIALHYSHHQRSSTPYYRLTPHKASPRLPGGYIPLLFLSLVPALFRRFMEPALSAWKRDPAQQNEPKGRRIICMPVVYGASGASKRRRV